MKTNPRTHWTCLVISIALAVCAITARAQDEPAPESAAPPEQAPAEPAPEPRPLPPVAATVDGEPIFVSEIEATYQYMQRSGSIRGSRPEDVKAALLSQLVDQRLAQHALARDPTLIKEGEVEKLLAEKEAQAKEQGMTLDEMCAKTGVTIEALRNSAMFRVAGQRFLERDLADNLEAYFNANKKELDGTEIRASHIMLLPNRYDETTREIQQRAAKIREEIESGSIDFASAARKYSVGPSREQGGDLGFIPRHGVMLEEFGEALFKLKPGEISAPVSTALGTHLIKATDVKPGGRQWTQVIPQIRQFAAKEKLGRLIEEERKTAKVEFTGKVPHYEPGTKIVAVQDK